MRRATKSGSTSIPVRGVASSANGSMRDCASSDRFGRRGGVVRGLLCFAMRTVLSKEDRPPHEVAIRSGAARRGSRPAPPVAGVIRRGRTRCRANPGRYGQNGQRMGPGGAAEQQSPPAGQKGRALNATGVTSAAYDSPVPRDQRSVREVLRSTEGEVRRQ